MAEFVIFTDSGSDLPKEKLEEMNVGLLSLVYSVDDCEPIPGNQVVPEEFYAAMRENKKTQTAAFSPETAREAFEEELKKGKDILYLGLSSGISRSSDSGRLAAEELAEKYPERKIYAIDTLCASLGLGLMVYEVSKLRDEGKSIDEAKEFVINNKLSISHRFTVDDLMFLKRGGRVSAATAIIGSALQIKPIMHVNDEGKLIKLDTARGRKGSLNALVKKVESTIDTSVYNDIFIVQADCEEDANYVSDKLKESLTDVNIYSCLMGPVIASHAGPGTIAIFYFSNER